ncbi:MAG: hypothetical protein H8E46_07910 [FCB group bacterium]|nr:hypothetical protein [FCB group bacterium]
MPEEREPFLPTSWGKVEEFYKSYKKGLEENALTFEIPQEDVDAETASIDATIAAHDDAEAKRLAAKEATSLFNSSKKDTDKSIRATVRRVKAHKKYTETIGIGWGIVGPESHYEPSEMKVVLKLKFNAGIVEIKFVRSHADCINIYCKRGDETEFTFLARDTESPYHDDRPNLTPGKAETRRYYAYYIFNDEEQGLPSDIVEIAVPG